MNRSSLRFSALMLVCWLSSLLAGCARSPQVNFYTLAPVAQATTVVPPPFSVAVAPVTLPDFIDRPQLVVITDSSRVHILELHRWAEPLKNAIPRLLAENLSRLLATDRISYYPQRAFPDAEYRVYTDFLRFDSTADTVMLEALWDVRTAGDGPGNIHRFKISERAVGEGNEARVAAYSRALAALSREIADSLRSLHTVPH